MKREGETKVTFEEKEVALVMIEYKLPSFAFMQTIPQSEQPVTK